MKIFQKHKAFTLSEVLITLTVIGVVAALTIPVLVGNSQKAEYYTAFQKGYAEMFTVIDSLVFDSGDMASSIHSFGSLTKAIQSKVIQGKFCAESLPYGTCMSSSIKFSTGIDNFDSYDMIVFPDGAAIAIQPIADDCTWNYGNYTDACGAIYLDTNGLKKPNQVGRDVFFFIIRNKKLMAEGEPGSGIEEDLDWYCNPAIEDPNGGRACATKLLQERAMNY